jgi:hypothetical protein
MSIFKKITFDITIMNEEHEGIVPKLFRLYLEGRVGNGAILENLSRLNILERLFPFFRTQTQNISQTPKIEAPKPPTETQKPQKERPYGAPIKTYG